jgi:hypothetical protein
MLDANFKETTNPGQAIYIRIATDEEKESFNKYQSFLMSNHVVSAIGDYYFNTVTNMFLNIAQEKEWLDRIVTILDEIAIDE